MLFLVAFLLTGNMVNSQHNVTVADSTDLPAHSIRAIAKVRSAEYDYMVIVIENVVSYSRGVTSTPVEGDELTVRLPGRNKPAIDSRIEVDLKESIDVGAMPSSYIALDFRSID